MIIVLKFGGTSVGSLIGFKNILEILMSRHINKRKLIVVSAASGSTNMLIKIANGERDIILEYINKERELNTILGLNNDFLELYSSELNSEYNRDTILSFGERISMHRLYTYLNMKNMKNVKSVKNVKMSVSWDLGFIVEKSIIINDSNVMKIIDKMDSEIIITTGFIGKNSNGNIVTLGRGGGDLSAALFASALNAECLEIWSDVPGIMTCDPRMISTARIIDHLTYEEALELSFYGAKILHSKTVEPLVTKNISLRVLNTFDLTCRGTLITNTKFNTIMEQSGRCTGLSFQKDMVIVYISPKNKLVNNEYLLSLFNILDSISVNCSMISISKTSVSFIISKDDISYLSDFSDTIQSNTMFTFKIAVICIVGKNLYDTRGIAALLFNTINANIEMISQSHSQTNILVAIKDNDLQNVLNNLHLQFFEK